MKRRTRRSLIAIAVIASIGVAGWVFLTERPIAVQVVTIDRDVPVRIYGLGTVEARIVSRIGFEVGAALTGLEVDSGDAVARGQILARLHATEQEARVARAAASVEAAGATLGRTRANVVRARAVLAQREATNTRQQALAVRNTISAQRAEEAQRDVDVAAAELAVAESDIAVALAQRADAEAALRYEQALLDHHVLRAPFDAIVVDRNVELTLQAPFGGHGRACGRADFHADGPHNRLDTGLCRRSACRCHCLGPVGRSSAAVAATPGL